MARAPLFKPCALLQHPEARVRTRCVALLAWGAPQGLTTACDALENLMDDHPMDIGADVVPLLERVGGQKAQMLLTQLAKGLNETIATDAQAALRRLRDEHAVIDAEFSWQPKK